MKPIAVVPFPYNELTPAYYAWADAALFLMWGGIIIIVSAMIYFWLIRK